MRAPLLVLLISTWTVKGIGANPTTGRPKDCKDILRKGEIYEGHYVVYPESSAPNKTSLIYCSQEDGMDALPGQNVRLDPAKNCFDLLQSGMTSSGVNIIYPLQQHPNDPVLAFCDQATDGGGWTVIQSRYDGSIDFYRPWRDYAEGFGNVAEEHYLGNDIISALTEQYVNELRVELEDWYNYTVFAHYRAFYVDTTNDYLMQVFSYEGSAGDSLYPNNAGQPFTTFDADNDDDVNNCAEDEHGAWWYMDCTLANLNGRYYPGDDHDGHIDAMRWNTFRGDGSLKSTRMMVRPYSGVYNIHDIY